jgi:hypothetical protein
MDDTSLLRSDSQFLFPNKMPLTIPPELKSITPYIRRAEEVRFISKISLDDCEISSIKINILQIRKRLPIFVAHMQWKKQ